MQERKSLDYYMALVITKAIWFLVKLMVGECVPGLVVIDMMASLKMTEGMVEECLVGLMVIDMMASSRMTN